MTPTSPEYQFPHEVAHEAGLTAVSDYFLDCRFHTPIVVITAQGIETLRAKIGKPLITYKVERSKSYHSVILAIVKVRDGKSIRPVEALGSSNKSVGGPEHAQDLARARAILAASEIAVLGGCRVITYLDYLPEPKREVVPDGAAADFLAVMELTGRAEDKNVFRHYEKGVDAPMFNVDGFIKAQDAAREPQVKVTPESLPRPAELEAPVNPSEDEAEAPDLAVQVDVVAQEKAFRIAAELPLVEDATSETGKPVAVPAEPASTSQAASTTAAESGDKAHPLAHLSDEELKDTLTDTLSHSMIWASERKACVAKLPTMERDQVLKGIDFYNKTIEGRILDGKHS